MAMTSKQESTTSTTAVSPLGVMEEGRADNTTDNDNMETIAVDDEPVVESQNNVGAIEEALEEQTNKAFYIKVVVGLVFVAFVVFIIVDLATSMHSIDVIHDFLNWVQEHPVEGVFAFALVYFVATIFLIPGVILTLGSGFVFAMAFGLGAGVALGTLVVFLGASAGAIVSFLLGRYLLRQQMQKLTKKYAIFEALEAALEKNGLRIFLLLRLSPIIPFGALNYIAGVTSVVFRDYCIALFAILPGTILYVFLGASAASLTDAAMNGSSATIAIVVSVVGAVFGFLAIFVTTRFAKKELNRVLEERRRADGNGEEQQGIQEECQNEEGSSTHIGIDESSNMNGSLQSRTVDIREFDV